MIYFTSDWHIGHDKDFLYSPRGFSSIEEHDTEVLKRCNEIVNWDDELWILGDLALGQNEPEWNRIYCNLNCQNIHYLIGNHDTNNKMDIYDGYGFIFEGYVTVFKYSKRYKFYLSHYPTITANFDDDHKIPFINLYGHTHQKTNFYNNNPYMYHVGLDSHNCYPVSIEDVIKDIYKHREETHG